MPRVMLLAPFRLYAQNDEMIVFCFPTHLQFAFKPPLTEFAIGSMRINQFHASVVVGLSVVLSVTANYTPLVGTWR